jgi:hypothetical protein
MPSIASAMITDSEIAAAIKKSEDLEMHSGIFMKASKKLVVDGRCTLQDLRIVGGWLRRTAKQHRIYVTYCGGSAAKNRLYLDVMFGRIYH